eukprot:656141-Rhodomonas_salina.1
MSVTDIANGSIRLWRRVLSPYAHALPCPVLTSRMALYDATRRPVPWASECWYRVRYALCGTDVACGGTRHYSLDLNCFTQFTSPIRSSNAQVQRRSFLRACYRMSGTDLAYRATIPIPLRASYGMSGTEIVPLSVCYHVRGTDIVYLQHVTWRIYSMSGTDIAYGATSILSHYQ